LARLSYPDPAQLSGATQWVLAQLPVPLHIFQMLAHAETALGPILLLVKAILGGQELAPHLREMAILQVPKQAEADYEWVQHVPIAKAAGVTDEQIALVEAALAEGAEGREPRTGERCGLRRAHASCGDKVPRMRDADELRVSSVVEDAEARGPRFAKVLETRGALPARTAAEPGIDDDAVPFLHGSMDVATEVD